MLAFCTATAIVAGPRIARAHPPGAAPPSTGFHAHRPQAYTHAIYEPAVSIEEHVRVEVHCLGVTEEQHRTRVRFRFELSNPTEEDLELDEDALFVDWAEPREVPEQARDADEVTGQTELEPGESAKVEATFPLDAHVEPEEVYVLRIRWRIESGLQMQALFRSVFIREERTADARFLFVPFFDPFGSVGIVPGIRLQIRPHPFHGHPHRHPRRRPHPKHRHPGHHPSRD